MLVRLAVRDENELAVVQVLEEIGHGAEQGSNRHALLSLLDLRMTREIVARAPTRIDLGGGWTDVPPYCDREGGFVCNVAITRYARVRVSGSSASRTRQHSDALVRAAL